jgi:hypothetical protein
MSRFPPQTIGFGSTITRGLQGHAIFHVEAVDAKNERKVSWKASLQKIQDSILANFKGLYGGASANPSSFQRECEELHKQWIPKLLSFNQ